ncbi:DUF2059 domain-containing protein [Roseivivax sp. CAU 1761]
MTAAGKPSSMMRHILPFVAACAVPAMPATAGPIEDLAAALRIPDLVSVMREEGLAQGKSLAGEMLPSGPNPAWTAILERIYDTGRMEEVVIDSFEAHLAPEQAATLLDFFAEGDGREITRLEIEARQAMLDPAVEEAARETYRARLAETGGLPEAEDGAEAGEETGAADGAGDGRLARLDAFVAANDLVENNVMGAMNASLMFYGGLAEGGGIEMSEDEILADVWAQEEETRAETEEWVKSFLLMAYEPLSAERLDAYIALSSAPEGQALNRALFTGFNEMYEDISYALGLALAQQMRETDL